MAEVSSPPPRPWVRRAPRVRLVAALAVGLAVVAASLLALPRARGADVPGDPWVRFVVLHTNDVHGGLLPRSAALAQVDAKGEVGGFAALASVVRREREAARATGAHVLLLDAGDLWRGTPEGDLTRGDLVVEAFGRLGYDAVALGNHDLDFGVENAKRLATAAPFPWVSANVTERATGRVPAWLKPHVVLEAGGLRVAVVGLTTTETPRIVMGGATMGLAFESETAAAAREAAALEGKADVLLFLTHLGPERDAAVLGAVPSCPLVVGGHSHTRLYKPIDPRRDGRSWIVQAGTACVVVGRVHFRVHRETKEVVLEDAGLIPLVVSDVGSDQEAAAFLAERLDGIEVLKPLREVVATLAADLPRVGGTPYATSPAGNAVADAMRRAAKTDAALANRGGLRVSLPKGPVTGRDLYLLMPFDNTIVDVPLTGAELKAVLAASLSGQRVSPLEVSGILGRYRREGEGPQARVVWTRFEVAGAPVDDAKTYRVAVNSFLAQGGDGYGALTKAGSKDLGTPVRDAIREFLSATTPFVPDPVSRFDGR